jgi:hypothetical protein
MATWGAHIRIAEELLSHFPLLDPTSFLVGNVGPDCGVPNEDWSQFSPPKRISHWINDHGSIDPEAFYRKHLSADSVHLKAYSFLLGYYSHLLTDIEWGDLFKTKIKMDSNYLKLHEDPTFIWTIKKDWYDIDFLYFRQNPSSIYHTLFKKVNAFPDYLDYYPARAVQKQVEAISEFYSRMDRNLERDYIYLTENEMNVFVQECVVKIVEQLNLKFANIKCDRVISAS